MTYRYTKEYYAVYSREEDKTFILCDETKNGIRSIEVVGFHFGEPDEWSFDFIGNTKATFWEK